MKVISVHAFILHPLPLILNFLLTFRALLNNYLPSPKGAYVPNDLCSGGIMR